MSAVIIDFRPNGMTIVQGNGAREALTYIGERLPNTSSDDAARWADWLLAEFWAQGFKVVPVESNQ